MTPYITFQYLFPPRPEKAISRDLLPIFERRGWVGQYKKNGTNTIIYHEPEHKLQYWNRHEKTQSWNSIPAIDQFFKELFPNQWFVLVAELLHQKHPAVKNTLFIHDILVCQSELLTDITYEDRLKILSNLFPTNVEAASHTVVTENIWVAKTFKKDFVGLFNAIKDPKLDEGLVLKDPNAKLKSCNKADTNSGWQIKCRYATKNYNS